MNNPNDPYAPPLAPVADTDDLAPRVKPPAIGRAVKILWASLGVGFCNAMLDFEHLNTLMSLSGLLMIWAFSLTLMGFVFIKLDAGRRWARTLFAVLFALGIPSSAGTIMETFSRFPLVGVVSLVQIGMQVYALTLLFSEAGKAWYGKPSAR